ncbi:MAG TPA: hypothetical protein VK044_09505 [Virgibacillus sp.]|nr:hypothetical protein [Virgibacillus sp.]
MSGGIDLSGKRRVIHLVVSLVVIFTVLVYFDYRKYEELLFKSNFLEALFMTAFIQVAHWYVDFIDKREAKKKKENEENTP